MKINLSEIRIDGGTQSRVELNQDVVAEYADAYAAGKRMPDISLFFDGTTYWLADGFHRYFGAKKAGKTSIDAESKDGTQRDAWLYSLGANAEHGLRRTNADKRKAVLAAFDDSELGQWTARQIAEACAVSHTYVNRLRDERESLESGNVSTGNAGQMKSGNVSTAKHGTQAVMNTANIGRNTPPAAPDGKPETPGPSQPETGQGDDLLQETGTAHVGRDRSGAADPATDEDDLLDSMRRRIKQLNDQVEALAKDDMAAEARKQMELRIVVEQRLDDQMRVNSALNAELRTFGKWQADLFRAAGTEYRAEVLRIVKQWRATQQEAAA